MDDNRAEWDARTLAEAEQIKNDANRVAAAKAAAERLAKEDAEKAKAMKKVAGQSVRRKSPNDIFTGGLL